MDCSSQAIREELELEREANEIIRLRTESTDYRSNGELGQRACCQEPAELLVEGIYKLFLFFRKVTFYYE